MKFLFFAPQGLGDSLEVTPALRMLRTAYPQADIHVAVMRSGPRALFDGLPELADAVHYLPFWEKGKAAFLAALLPHVVRTPYDCTFMAYPAARREYHWLAGLIPARRRVAHRYAEADRRNGLRLYTDLVPIRDAHNVLRNVDLLRAFGVQGAIPDRCELPSSWRPQVKRSEIVAMHVGSVNHDGFALKRWPPHYFAEIGRRLTSRGYGLRLISGPDERQVTQTIADAIPGVSLFEGTLPEVARFLGSCSLLLANDSGIGHLAAAAGTPVVTLLGPTPLHCAPFAPNVVALRPSSCPPCFTPAGGIPDCPAGTNFACLREDLSVEIVENACLSILQNKTSTSAVR